MTEQRERPALFLDRDGVMNEEIGYLWRAEDVRFVSGIFSLCRTAMRLRYQLVVVTNQSGIARGLYTEEDFTTLMAWISCELTKEGVELAGIYYCPFHPEHGVGQYRREHEDRKPGPGMLLRAARDLDLDLKRSVMVGDRCSDVSAATTAGLRAAFLLAGTEQESCPGSYTAIAHLSEVEVWLDANP